MKKKFLIFSEPYDELSGGFVVLHKLCSILNQLGFESYMYPYFDHTEINKCNYFRRHYILTKLRVKNYFRGYKTNPAFTTPVYSGPKNDCWKDWIVIYPEVVFGNPLNAKNVIRWLLHNPGFHSGEVHYGSDELYFKFNTAINDFSFPGSETSTKLLKVIHYPMESYNIRDAESNRAGTAYCIRKGSYKKIAHDLENSILIDGKSHDEVAKIFKRVKTFISYDSYTAYSIFAVLCGCESIVVPDEGVDEKQWYENPKDRYGLSYGFSNIARAKKTSHLVKEHVINEEKKSVENVKQALEEINEFFDDM